MWMDFATGEGGDIFDAWARVMGIDAQRNFPQLVESVAQWLGVPSSLAVDQQPSSSEFALGASSKSAGSRYFCESLFWASQSK
jgi:hypothetical protein